MPRKPAQASKADLNLAPGGSAAVDRALSLLGAFRAGDNGLTLADLAARTGLYKSTTLRLLASLVHAGLVQRGTDQRYGLGPELARLGALCSASSSLQTQLLPVMRELVASTGESVSFHVRRGRQRLCLLRVDSTQVLRDNVRAGDVLPLNRGAGGRVLLAYAGQRGALYTQIRQAGVAVLSDDRVVGLTGVAAPVWGAQGELVGALTLTLPGIRMRAGLAEAVRQAALTASRALGGAADQGP